MSCNEFIYNDGYADFLVDFNYDIDEVYIRFNPDCVNVLNNKYAIFYKDIKKSGVFDSDRFSFNIIPYDSWPKLYALLDNDNFVKGNRFYVNLRDLGISDKVVMSNNKVVLASDNGNMDVSDSNDINSLFNSVLQETGVSSLRRFDAFDLTGRDVLIGFVDTGINANLDIFKYEDGRSKIIAIWDQTFIDEGNEADYVDNSFFEYGRFYDVNEINDGIASGENSDFLGGMDYNGHGTSLATGAISIAPDSSLVVVKLKEAKNSLKNFYGLEENVLCFSETDVLAGILFLEEIARRENKPLVICMGIGTNQGEHEGKGYVGEVINYLSNSPGIAVVVAGGNEVIKRHHFRGDIFLGDGFGGSLGGFLQESRGDSIGENSIDEVEINVGENIKGFFFEIWTQNPNNISIGLVTPMGEVVPRIINNNNNSEVVSFLFENTSVLVAYDNNVSSSGNAVVFVKFINPSEGIWRINVYKNSLIEGRYDIWLPISNLINSSLEIVNSNPETTLSQIANTSYVITVSGYNHENGGIYVNSSRGYTFDERIKPDIAAPAVDIKSLNNRGNIIEDSGTSISSAITSGIVALLFEWAIVNNNYRNMDGVIAKKFLIRGAVKEDGDLYPNKEWGYGKVNIYETFNTYRTY